MKLYTIFARYKALTKHPSYSYKNQAARPNNTNPSVGRIFFRMNTCIAHPPPPQPWTLSGKESEHACVATFNLSVLGSGKKKVVHTATAVAAFRPHLSVPHTRRSHSMPVGVAAPIPQVAPPGAAGWAAPPPDKKLPAPAGESKKKKVCHPRAAFGCVNPQPHAMHLTLGLDCPDRGPECRLRPSQWPWPSSWACCVRML